MCIKLTFNCNKVKLNLFDSPRINYTDVSHCSYLYFLGKHHCFAGEREYISECAKDSSGVSSSVYESGCREAVDGCVFEGNVSEIISGDICRGVSENVGENGVSIDLSVVV